MSVTDQEIDQIRDRQTRLESTVSTLAKTTEQIADNQRQQQEAISVIGSDVQSILTSLKTREGRVDLKIILTVIVPLGGFIAFFLTMYLAPLKNQVDNNQAQFQFQVTSLRKDLEDFLGSDGTAKTQVKLAVHDAQLIQLRKDVDRQDDAVRRRLEEEAAIGRKMLYGAKEEKK